MRKFFATICSSLLAAAFSLAFPTTGLAHGDWPDGPHKEWFQNLQRPDNDAHPLGSQITTLCSAVALLTLLKQVQGRAGDADPPKMSGTRG